MLSVDLSPVETAASITAVGVVTSALIAWFGQRPRLRLDKDQAVFTRLENMVKILGDRVDTLERENKALRDSVSTLEQDNQTLRQRVVHLERELQQHGIALPVYQDHPEDSPQ